MISRESFIDQGAGRQLHDESRMSHKRMTGPTRTLQPQLHGLERGVCRVSEVICKRKSKYTVKPIDVGRARQS